MLLVGWQERHPACKKTRVVVCLEQDADLHMAQLMPLPLTVSCFSKIQIGFTFLVSAHLGSLRKRAVKRVCVSTQKQKVMTSCTTINGLLIHFVKQKHDPTASVDDMDTANSWPPQTKYINSKTHTNALY